MNPRARSHAQTSRRAVCQTCGAGQFEFCLDDDGNPTARSHPARVIAARSVPTTSPAMFDACRKLHLNESAYISPTVRHALLDHGLATSPDGPIVPQPGRRGRRPRQRLLLTAKGREAIGVAVKIARDVSDPPPITDEDLQRVQRESQQLYEAFEVRTREMEDP